MKLQAQYLSDLDTYMVKLQTPHGIEAVLLDGQPIPGLSKYSEEWREIKNAPSRLTCQVKKETAAAYYASKEMCTSVYTADSYHERINALHKLAYDPDELDEDDEPYVVVDKEAYDKLKFLKAAWKYYGPEYELVIEPVELDLTVTKYHHQNKYLTNQLVDGDPSKASLWTYNRYKAVITEIRECFESLGVEELPASDHCSSVNVADEQKAFRFYNNGMKQGKLEGLRWMKAWGKNIFYGWQFAEQFENGWGRSRLVGTEQEMLMAYNQDKKAIWDKITLAYNERWKLSAGLNTNQATEILTMARSAQSSLAGIRERRDSKGSSSGARNTLTKIINRLEEIIRG